MPSIERYENTAGRWYRVRYRTPDRRQTSKRGFRTKRDAERFLATVEVAQMRGEWVDPSRSIVNLSAVAEEWFAGQIGIKPTTRSGYRYSLDRHVLPRWGTTPLARVTHGEVQRWVNELSARLRPSTVRQIHLVLAQVFKFAIRDGRIARNPAADVELPRITKERRGYLTHSQVRLLSERCGEYGDVVLLLAYTGLRWGELAALSIGSVDLNRRRIEVERSVTEVGGTLVWGTPKTHHRRSVPIPELIVDSIVRRSAGRGSSELVFVTPRGEVLRSGNFRHRVFDRAVRDAREADRSMPRVTPHDLRHTAASLAISAGANVKAVQRMLGHASAAMTLDVYADLFDDDLHAVAHALDAAARAAEG